MRIDKSGAVDKIADKLWNMETRVDIYEYRVPTEELWTLVNTVLHTHPELFYVSGRYYSNMRYDPVTKKDYLSEVVFHWGKVNIRDVTQLQRFLAEFVSL